MMKHKRNDDGLLTPTNYLELKLGIKHNLDEEELFEYSKYINGRLQNENVLSGLFSNFMLPIIISALTPIFTEIFTQYLNVSYDDPILDFLAFLIRYGACITTLFLLIKIVAENAQENKACNLFYKDVYEIIISKLQ